MYKKRMCIFMLLAVFVFSLSACSSSAQENDTVEEFVVSEVSVEKTDTADVEIEDAENADETVSVETTETDEISSEDEFPETESIFSPVFRYVMT